MTNEELWKKIERGLSNITPKCQLNFEMHLVEHCNLNCKLCGHFSPLAEEEYTDVSSYRRDCNRLSELFDGEMATILLMGGEPLLHPQVTEFMRITREGFPVGNISIVTNGLLLPTMPDDFWAACRKYDIIIAPTCYPIKFDYAGLKKIADSKGVKYTPFDYVHSTHQKLFPICSTDTKRLDIEGTKHFLNCMNATNCVTLKNGKMFPCPQAAHASHLKKYFNLDIHLSEKDGVDIYSVKSGNELLEKLSRPIPFCRYCDVTDNHISCDWGISRKDRYEWLTFGFTEDDMKYLKTKKPVVYIFGAGKWGTQAVNLLLNERIVIKYVLSTRKKQGIDNILGIPIVTLDELGEVEPNSVCLVALGSPLHKSEVYPILSQIGFGDVVPVAEI